ncbi:hypothetical protein BDC45DRAFT_496636 [Circinella umbellata]|nr:hypothetical protein BDC45DRAFT_496636 [Circinella umbellata]
MPPYRPRSNSANGTVNTITTSSNINSSNNNQKQRLFQCTGYGDCRMVFTRSEHLARHARKHTGEKPFKCIMPDCNKMFSRFDNMMQHTQTHRNHHLHQHNQQQPLLRRRRRSSTASSTSSNSSTNTTASFISDTSTGSCSSSNSSVATLSDNDPVITPSATEKQEPLLPPRRLSIADLCNPSATVITTSTSSENSYNNNQDILPKKNSPSTNEKSPMLTPDELEALQAFGRLQRVATSDFFDSLQDLVSERQCACL